jgi:hypothetical protein
MGPKRYARSIWFAMTVFFAVMVLRCWQLASVDPYPPGYHGVRCGMGAIAFLFGMMVFTVLGLISLLVFFTRKKQ